MIQTLIDYRKNNRWTVYIHLSPSNKYYVGITSQNVNRRWGANGCNYKGIYFYNAIQKYGWDNFEHMIIANNLTHEEANDFEKTLIKSLKSNEREYGYNISSGGDGGNKKSIKSVKQYDLDGNFIQEFSSASEASRYLGFDRTHITKVCKHGGTTHGFMFSYANETILSPFTRKNQKPVIQCTLDGEFVNEYISLKDASNQTNIPVTNISKCIYGNNSHASGYIWFYKD